MKIRNVSNVFKCFTTEIDLRIESADSTSPSKKKSKDKTTPLVTTDYLEILGSNVTEPTRDVQDQIVDDEREQLIKDKQATLEKAMKAASDGNAEDASFLFRLHSRMVIPPLTVDSLENVQRVTISPREVQREDTVITIGEDERPFVENGITFMPGKPDCTRLKMKMKKLNSFYLLNHRPRT